MKEGLSILDSNIIRNTVRAMGAGDSLAAKIVDQARKRPTIAKTALLFCDPTGDLLECPANRQMLRNEPITL